ncbi:MAG TPA: hypothetical protein VNM47_02255 [Terriglobia bacterium]|nr:hypothetical protein [Terriglobia bacterium]
MISTAGFCSRCSELAEETWRAPDVVQINLSDLGVSQFAFCGSSSSDPDYSFKVPLLFHLTPADPA